MSGPGSAVRRRASTCLFGAGLLLAALAMRLVWVQWVRGQGLYQGALDVRTRVVPVQAERGSITDAEGHILALSVGVESAYATPGQIRDKQADAAALAGVLGGTPADWLPKLQRHLMFVWLRRKLPPATVAALRRLRLPGIHLVQESRRVYPRGMFAAQVLGFVGLDNQGLSGVELSYNAALRGQNGAIMVEADAANRELPMATSRYLPPVEGDTLRLTLDGTLQYVVQRDLDAAVARNHALAGYALMMDPRTGAILALASWPTFDPNHFADADPSLWTNPVLTYAFSPGSVFKPVTAAAALQAGVVTPSTGFFDTGVLRLPGATIHNAGGSALGATTFAEGFRRSANTIFARVGIMLGVDRFYHFLDEFGFMGRTGVDLPGESARPNILRPRALATPLDVAEEAFGQTLAVTPISVLTAISAIANGGELPQPHIAAALLRPNGVVVRRFDPPPVRRVISPQVARQVQTLMAAVVAGGTGRNAAIPCYSIAGKTGTTQKYARGRIAEGSYIASFLGYAPAHGARLALYVMIDEPAGAYYGGQVAAPVFRSIMLDALRQIGLPPSCPRGVRPPAGLAPGADQVAMPDLVGLPAGAASAAAGAAGLYLRVEGAPAGPILRQVPPAGAPVQRWSTVLGYTDALGGTPGGAVQVPDLGGMTLAQAASALLPFGLQLDAAGSGRVVAQAPAPGSAVPPGSAVAVQLGPFP